MSSYQTFIQRCSLTEINFDEEISYIVYGSNSTTGAAVPFDTQPINTNMLHPNVHFFLIQVNPINKNDCAGGLELVAFKNWDL